MPSVSVSSKVVSRALAAAKSGDVKTLEAFGKARSLHDTVVDEYGASCVHYGARSDSVAVLDLLVRGLGLSGCRRTSVGATPLHDAAASGSVRTLGWLLENTACKVDDQDDYGLTPCHLAAKYGHGRLLRWLVDDTNCDILKKSATGALPLHFAVLGGSLESVRLLVRESPRSVNVQMHNGVTSAYLASQEGKLDILKFLILEAKGTVKIIAFDGMTCVHAAAQMGHLHVLKWLVEGQCCNSNERDFDGATPLHYAASCGHAGVLQWLLQKGRAKITLDNLGGSPLHNAAELGQIECVRVLLDNKCNIDITDNSGLTAAELAEKCWQTECADLIRGHPPDVDSNNLPQPSAKVNGCNATSSITNKLNAEVLAHPRNQYFRCSEETGECESYVSSQNRNKHLANLDLEIPPPPSFKPPPESLLSTAVPILPLPPPLHILSHLPLDSPGLKQHSITGSDISSATSTLSSTSFSGDSSSASPSRYLAPPTPPPDHTTRLSRNCSSELNTCESGRSLHQGKVRAKKKSPGKMDRISVSSIDNNFTTKIQISSKLSAANSLGSASKSMSQNNNETTSNSSRMNSTPAPPPPPPPPPPLPPTPPPIETMPSAPKSSATYQRASLSPTIHQNGPVLSPSPSTELIAEMKAMKGRSMLKKTTPRLNSTVMVYTSKGMVAADENKQAVYQPPRPKDKPGHNMLEGEFNPKNFVDKVPHKDASGREIPAWKRQVLARQYAEKAKLEYEEKSMAEQNEKRFKNVPAWKRALMEKKDAELKAAKEKKEATRLTSLVKKPVANRLVVNGNEARQSPWQDELGGRKQ